MAESQIVQVFVALFLVANALPVLPIFVAQTEALEPSRRRSLAIGSVAAGTLLAVCVALFGPVLFAVMGINVHELRIAGGLILFVFATHDILFSTIQRKRRAAGDPEDEIGIVPLGIPILVGPATLATAIGLANDNARGMVVIAILITGLINLMLLRSAFAVTERMGSGLIRAISSVLSLLLAAIAVSMVRLGLAGLLG